MKNLITSLVFLFFYSSIVHSQIVNIPDVNFKNALVNTNCVDIDGDNYGDIDADLNNDGEIQTSEAESVYRLIVNDKDINSLEGIDFFSNLFKLSCSKNNLTTLDLTNNLDLFALSCYDNDLSNINLSNNLILQELSISINDLTEIDLQQNLNLTKVWLSGNEIGNIDVSQLTNLEIIDIGGNPVANLNLSQNINLKRVHVSFTNLTELEIAHLSNLERLSYSYTSIPLIDTSVFSNLKSLSCSGNQFTNIDVSQNLLLEDLRCRQNNLTSLDVSQNSNLGILDCSENNISSLDVSNNLELKGLIFSNNNVSSIDLTENINLLGLYCNDNLLTTLDVNQNTELYVLKCENNQLNSLYIKNNKVGLAISHDNSNPNGTTSVNFNGNPDLEYICVDDSYLFDVQNLVEEYGYTNVDINSYCSLDLGGEFFVIQGQAIFDNNEDGCDTDDNYMPFIKLNITDGVTEGTYISDSFGNYSISVNEGVNTITPIIDNSDYFSISPQSVVVDFPSDASPLIQDFCVSANGDFNDLEITIIPLDNAIPGFEAEYKIVYKNKGTTVLMGSVNLLFNENMMDLITANPINDTQASGSLNWDFTNLHPFEEREIFFSMSLNTPTDTNFPLNSGDVLVFESSVNSLEGDETPQDNEHIIYQEVINSFDPNDKTCLTGDIINFEQVGDYVHYMIRFENNGTANARNIIVKDIIDQSKYDLSTIKIIDASHHVTTNIKNDNIIEFVFKDIFLPFDDSNNDGYVVFKIKTLTSLQLGDTFKNNAEIYFDYNSAITTNYAITTVSNEELPSINSSIKNTKVFPNPVKDFLTISSKSNVESISIFDSNSRLLNTIKPNTQVTEEQLDFRTFSSGLYFVEVKSQDDKYLFKIVVF